MKAFRKISWLVVLYLCFWQGIVAQSNGWNLWSGIEVEKRLGKKWEIAINPEWRILQWHSQNEYLLETSVSYDPIPYIRLGAKYRFKYLHEQESGTNIYHQMAFDVKGRYRKERFKFELRTRLTNYTDFEIDEYLVNPYLRYRFQLEYDIKGIPLFPFASFELFHQLDDREINKLRYTVGLEYRLKKNHRVEIKYHLQNYLKKEYLRNVIALQYKFVF